jgi:MOSC domain-containing protein YiiM
LNVSLARMTLAPIRPLVLVGSVAPLGDGALSAIAKRLATGPWRIEATGLVGDAQADLKNHGGPEKALHQYPREHYAAWAEEIGNHPLLLAPGAFGENLSATGWTEARICVGDVIRFGGARLQVSQGRQPCWKLNRRFGRTDLALRVQKSGRTGWYYRVLEAGVAREDDCLCLLDRPRPDWTLERLMLLLYRQTDDMDGLAGMAAVPELAQSWREIALRRLRSGKVENWAKRLYGADAPD